MAVAKAPAAAASPATPSAIASTGSDRELEKRLKLQNFLVMKAFNLRKGRQTLAQQFQPLRQCDALSGRAFLALGALCEFLSIPPFRRIVLCQIFHVAADAARIDFDAFVRFLQTAAVQAAHEERELRRPHSGSLPEPPPRGHEDTARDAIVCFAPSLLSMRFARPPPPPGLWKKREITIQERITEYTKIDELGRAQHLVEKEKHQSEVIHMESLDGEFAHREITHVEQLEQLNGEVVHHETGREEFVHLKSQHDEVSKFESSIPTAQGGAAPRPDECEQPPPSPTIKRDPSAMDCGMDGARAFHSPGRGEGEEEDGGAETMAPEEEEAYRRYQNQFGHHGDVPLEEMETLMEEYPME